MAYVMPHQYRVLVSGYPVLVVPVTGVLNPHVNVCASVELASKTKPRPVAIGIPCSGHMT